MVGFEEHYRGLIILVATLGFGAGFFIAVGHVAWSLLVISLYLVMMLFDLEYHPRDWIQAATSYDHQILKSLMIISMIIVFELFYIMGYYVGDALMRVSLVLEGLLSLFHWEKSFFFL